MTKPVIAGAGIAAIAAMAVALRIAAGVSIITQIGMSLGVLCGGEGGAGAADVVGARHLGDEDCVRSRRDHGGDVAGDPGCIEAVDAHDDLAAARRRGSATAATTASRARSLAVAATESSRSKISTSAATAAAFSMARALEPGT